MKPKAIWKDKKVSTLLAKVDKLDVDKLKTVTVDLSKLTYKVDNVVKKRKDLKH